MRFLRHLAAAMLTVAGVVALGVAWAHASGISRPGAARRPPAAGAPQKFRVLPGMVAGGRVIPGGRRVQPGRRPEPGADAAAETILLTAVVTVSAARHRRARRRRALS